MASAGGKRSGTAAKAVLSIFAPEAKAAVTAAHVEGLASPAPGSSRIATAVASPSYEEQMARLERQMQRLKAEQRLGRGPQARPSAIADEPPDQDSSDRSTTARCLPVPSPFPSSYLSPLVFGCHSRPARNPRARMSKPGRTWTRRWPHPMETQTLAATLAHAPQQVVAQARLPREPVQQALGKTARLRAQRMGSLQPPGASRRAPASSSRTGVHGPASRPCFGPTRSDPFAPVCPFAGQREATVVCHLQGDFAIARKRGGEHGGGPGAGGALQFPAAVGLFHVRWRPLCGGRCREWER